MAENTHLERCILILQRLQTQGEVSINDLYRYFDGNVTRRTLQRTISTLSDAHVPIVERSGAHNESFYTLRRGAFEFIPMQLKSDEILAALLLSQFKGYFDGTQVGESIHGVFEKLDQLMPSDAVAISSTFEATTDTLAVHEPGRVDLKQRGPILLEMFDAILRRHVCWVKYRGKRNAYQVHPYSILLHNGCLYAVVFQPFHGHWIYLALPRIEKLTATDEVFKRDDDFRLKEFLKDKFGLWSEKPATVKIRFKVDVRPSIEDRIWHHSQQLGEPINGHFDLTLRVGITEELIAWILRWGPFAEVKTPKSLRLVVKKRLEESLKAYK